MPQGILYVMTTVVDGLIKIGETGPGNFNQRMNALESNGYANVVGLKRRYAIKVDEYDEKEQLLHTLFAKSRVADTELFATDVELVIQLLSSFDGEQVFPDEISKDQVFNDAVNQDKDDQRNQEIPDGVYYLTRKIKRDGIETSCRLKAQNGRYVVLAGGQAAITETNSVPLSISAQRSDYIDGNGIVTENVSFGSVSLAADFVVGGSTDGWVHWKSEDGKTIDSFR